MNLTRRFLIGLLSSGALFASLATAASLETVTVQNKDNPGSLPILISLEQVGRDLHLTSLQKSVIAGLRNDYRAAAMKLTEEERTPKAETLQLQEKLDRLTVNYNDRALAVLNQKQRRRLRQIERQVLGGTLLTAPSEQHLLGLTQAQQEKIALLQQDSTKKAGAINLKASQGKLNYHRQVMALRKNRQQHAEAMLKVLTPEQLTAWKKAQGTALVF